ncbi:probable ATP-dependent RNA helicase ddx42 [Copidosoma floridanum]|uniref:probable ATP-dependent RNA helicase ddx42 n=1 Tax=Copidosoma floridanum TaxID=29053 RepID=UPI0006C94080|nr:probable ATP-dependent RNA helicase ddx42 [Copidosoma floridanum]
MDDSKMDTDDYVHENNKVFDILFQNIKAFELEEIRGFFERFGCFDVKSAGDETGYRFVKFRSYDDAKRAFEAYKENENFKFLKPRKKKQEQSNPIWEDRNINVSVGNSGKDGESNNSGQKNRRNSNAKGKQNCRHDYGNKSSPKSSNDNDGFENHFSAADSESYNSNKSDSKDSSHLFNSKPKYNSNNLDMNYLKKKWNSNVNNQTRPNNSRNSQGNSTDAMTQETNLEEMPDLELVKSKDSTRPILDAQEVVVGNIPCNYGSAYILHLFDNFEPLAVSNVVIEPKTNIRYCFVYFKSPEDSTRVESRFDRLDIEGKKDAHQRSIL